MYKILVVILALTTTSYANDGRARDYGIKPGILTPGAFNAITDVKGVRVGQVTLIKTPKINTGVTAIIPAEGVLRQQKVASSIWIGNGYGKLAGISQVQELGEIETPIILTNTLNIAEGIAATVEWTLEQVGNENVHSVNAVVGETNDGFLNDIRGRYVTVDNVKNAIRKAKSGPVDEGNVGAGTGTKAFGWKGGIGTSSRKLPDDLGAWTVGVLVQANYGGILTIDGSRVGEHLGQYFLKDTIEKDNSADGSIMIIVATDAPLSERNLERLGKRALFGLARTGATMSNGSGDYVIAFTNHKDTRRGEDAVRYLADLSNSEMSPLFQAVAEATEESIYNALFAAEDMVGYYGNLKALPIKRVVDFMKAK